MISLDERFWSKVAEPFDAHNDCWEWTAGKSGGYGIFGVNRKPLRAHRFAYEFFNGPIPLGFEPHHNCWNKACVNPTHLELVSHSEHPRISAEVIDFGAFRRSKTHCLRGHEFTVENTRLISDGSRRCRKCDAIRAREYRRRN
jgi:HNH endonuclease